MQVRHNTTLLEQAVDHVVRRASIPLIQAEAAAQERTLRAAAFRRLATGVAISLVAIGIGLGIYLSKRVEDHTEIAQKSLAAAEKIPPDQPKLEPVAVGKVTSERIPQSESPTVAPVKELTPSPITTNFSIFRDREAKLFGKDWKITTGHSFANETDQVARNWSSAWCYTNTDVNGLDVRIGLGERLNSGVAPIIQELSTETLTKIGLTNFEVLTLATQCPWLDGKSFNIETLNGSNSSKPAIFRLDGTTLYFSGEIKTEFSKQLAQYSFEKLDISSPGGLIDEALVAGRWLRSKRKIIHISDECLSACIFVLAGGASKQADISANIGVHRFFKDSKADVGDVELAQEKSADILQYLQSVGVRDELWFTMAKTPSETIQYIDHVTLREWGLLSPQTIDIPDDPTGAGAEKTEPAPSGTKTDVIPQSASTEEIVPLTQTETNSKEITDNSYLIRIADYDAPGNDYPGMPIRDLAESECQQKCLDDSKCMAATYNTTARVCFLKSGIAKVTPFTSAITFFRPELRGKF